MSLENYFKKQHENNVLQNKEIPEQLIEPIVIIIVLVYFLISQFVFTGFFLNNFGLLEAFFLYGPLLINIITSIIFLTTRDKQIGRLLSFGVNLYTAIGWLYLVLAPIWYDASKLYLIGSFLTNDIFYILMVLGIGIPLLMALWNIIVYYKVRNIDQNK